jgi:uncharacterized protein YjbJ (UPF0337 family)
MGDIKPANGQSNGQRSNRQQATGNRQQATGNRQQATGNRQQATGNYTYRLNNRVNYLTAYIFSPLFIHSPNSIFSHFGNKPLEVYIFFERSFI